MPFSNLKFLILLLLTHTMLGQEIEIPRASPKAAVSQTIGVCNITINYSRPSTRGRVIFGELIPLNKVWRAGANESTTISFNYPVKFDGETIQPGTYGLFIIPKTDSWTFILNKEWNQWGAYNYSKEKDVLRIEISPKKIDKTELCTFSFSEVKKSSGLLNIQWDTWGLEIPLETNTHEQTINEINKATSALTENWYIFSAAAQYHFYEKDESEKALEYINTAIALKAPNPAPWMLKSQILASQNQFKEAIENAEIAIKVSKKHNFLYEIEENESQISKWKLKIK